MRIAAVVRRSAPASPDVRYFPRHDRRHCGPGAVTPKAQARRAIDAQLEDAGWRVRDMADIDLAAGKGVAVREFPLKPGFGKADYPLYVDGAAAGVVEASKRVERSRSVAVRWLWEPASEARHVD